MKFKSDVELQVGLADKDGQLGTSGQILSSTGTQTNWITPNPGDITGVIAGNKLAGGGASGTVTLGLASDAISQWTNDSGYITSSSLPTVSDATVTVNTATGLDGATSFTLNQLANKTISLALDLNELAVGGTLLATDHIVAVNGTASQKQLISSIPLSIFNNNAGWTDNAGDITAVNAGSGISGGGTSGSVTVTNSDKGSSQAIFKKVAVSGQSTVIADSNNDTLTLVAAGGMTITTNATTDTITFNPNDDNSNYYTTAASFNTGDGIISFSGAGGQPAYSVDIDGRYVTTSGVTSMNVKTDGTALNVASNTITSTGTATMVWQGAGTQYVNGLGDLTTFPSIPQGDITSVTAGTGLSGGGTSGAVTLNLDLGELAVGGTLIATDYLIAENGGVDNRQLVSSIPLSIFNNNAGWTDNAGDITAVVAGTNLTGGGTSGSVTLNMATGGAGAGSYGSTSNSVKIDQITLDAYGRVTAVSTGATGAGSVTSITTSTGLSGGTITTSGTITNTDRGSQQNIFKNVAVSGQSTIVADSNNDTLTLVAAGGMTITTNASTDTITFNPNDDNSNYYTTAASFNTTNGIISFSGAGGQPVYSVDIDGRYVTSSGVTSINFKTDGTALNVNSNTITSSGTMTGIWQGTSNQYVNGLGDLTTFPSIPQGDITAVVAGTGMSGGGTSGSVTLNCTVTGDTGVPAILSNGTTPSLNSGISASEVRSLIGAGTSSSSGVTSITTSTGLSGGTITTTGTITNTDRGSQQSIFKNIAVSGQSTVVADNNNDTLTLVAAGGMTITTNATTDTITFNPNDDNSNYYTTAASFNTTNGIISFSGAGGQPTYSVDIDGRYVTTSGVTSINFKTDGTALNVASNTITSSGTMTGIWQGTSNQYVNGLGDLVTFPSIPQGDITGVTAGTGLSGGGTSGTVTLTLDLGELAVGGTLIATDYLIAENGGVDNRQLVSSIPLSIFNNNAGWTDNAGDITAVVAGTGMSGGGTSGSVTLNCTVTGDTGVPAILSNGTTPSLNSGISAAEVRSLIGAGTSSSSGVTSVATSGSVSGITLTGGTITSTGTITLGGTLSLTSANVTTGLGFTPYNATNPAGYTSNTGDITAVNAGTNITGGGTSGSVTINMATGGIGSGTYGSTSNSIKVDNITVDAYGRITAITTGSTGSGSGDITGVTAGVGISGGGTSGTVTVTLDIDELPAHSTVNAVQNDDYIAMSDTSASDASKKVRVEDLRKLESVLLPTNDFSGTIVRLTANETIAIGDALALSKSVAGRVVKARSITNSLLVPCMGIATTAASSGGSIDVLISGIANYTVFPFTSADEGKVVYLGTSLGDFTVTAPSTGGQQVQVVGIVITTDQILFNPSYNITVVA